MRLFIAFTVPGVAQPAGSKNSFVPTDRDTGLPYVRGWKGCKSCFGKSRPFNLKCKSCKSSILVNTVDSCKKSPEWKAHVHKCALRAMKQKGLTTIDLNTEGRINLTPLRLVLRFYQTRPAKHFRTGKFADQRRDDAPEKPTDAPDTTKLTRAVEDALMGAVYKEDSAIVSQHATKEFGREDCVSIEVWVYEQRVQPKERTLFEE
jgi:hypothetical protein